ncbi:DNA polymerase subunit gamma-1, mitochondrial [Tribolium madens]|uniref:DNA polymerase subunit gamma-1, mitochondrial n=1 Tax=Tribolium madens TaxID=41895 RepID=UPI001CF732E2|nr:DNA polymerase subunit gamma-1, mitochondrial [Tribolium madens]
MYYVIFYKLQKLQLFCYKKLHKLHQLKGYVSWITLKIFQSLHQDYNLKIVTCTMFCTKYNLFSLKHEQLQHVFKHYSVHRPSVVVKKFIPNPNKSRIKTTEPAPCTFEVRGGPRVNELNIQMLSSQLFEQVFKGLVVNKCDEAIVRECLKSLQEHNMVQKPESYMKDVEFQIPPLEGKNIEEHFHVIGDQQLKPYRELIEKLLTKIPEPPDKWEMQQGWTRYAPGLPPQQVPYPLEEGLVFDIEVAVTVGKAPTLATAVSSEAWYGWVSQMLLDGTSKPVTTHHYFLDQLIPLESTSKDTGIKLAKHMKQPKVIVGHNVSYDRSRIKEQYWLNQTGTRFIDTMSLHVCVSGLTSYQRAILKAGKTDEEDEIWRQQSSLNSLNEVHKLYCGGKSVAKETRDLFVTGSLNDIKGEFQTVMKYCSSDVVATYNVLKELFPMFLERFPHPVTLAGMLELSTGYLPINSNWNRYIDNSEQAYEDMDIEGRILLARRADQACQLLHDDKYKEDLWLWDQDWTVKNLRMKKNSSKRKDIETPPPPANDDQTIDPLEEKFRSLMETKANISSVNSHLPGYPTWYKKLCTKPDSSSNWIPGPHLISTSMRITPKLLSLTWEGFPLHYTREKGWGFLIPFTDDIETSRKLPLQKLLEKCPLKINKAKEDSGKDVFADITQIVQDNLMRKEYYSKLKKDKTRGVYTGTGIWCSTEIEDCCYFLKLPHKNGSAYNVGNPLSKDFLNKFSENVLAGDTESAEQVLAIARTLWYWRNNRDRIFDQMVVWLYEKNLPKHLSGGQYGAIIPQVVVCGTLTRRAVEPTWMTASNARSDRVGSELRAMVQAPPGYNIVGADVDSQELWIASIIGDSHRAKIHGATPFGWMTLSGNKSDATDMHSVTAKAVGISRDHAKVINYARIYGAGQNFAERLLKQFNPSMSEAEAKSKASKMFALTKGKRVYRLKKEFLMEYCDQSYSHWQAFEMAKSWGKRLDDMFERPKWVGGTESAMFNRLESIATNLEPRTPFLNGRLSRALEPKLTSDDRYLPTRINWVVQSGAADFLHLMLVCMRWIMGDKARFCLSFHDEVRYLVPERFKYQGALAMHVTNLLTRAFCSVRLGINDLPQSVAFFSTVEVDTVLRKDAKDDCKTPSNPHGLEKGYNIANGEGVDINQAVEKAGGRFSYWYEQLK